MPAPIVSEEQMMNFVRSNPELHNDFTKLIPLAIKEFKFAPTSKSSVRRRLRKAVDIIEKERRIPRTNNAGHAREAFSKERILKSNTYNFNNKWLRLMMSEKEFESFVGRYLEVKVKNASRRKTFTPSENELKLFEKFTQGKISIREFSEQLGAEVFNRSKITQKIGAIYAYITESKREENGK